MNRRIISMQRESWSTSTATPRVPQQVFLAPERDVLADHDARDAHRAESPPENMAHGDRVVYKALRA